MKGAATWRTKLTNVVTLFFILLFVYAAVSKLLDYEKFVVQIGQSPILTTWAVYLAWLIPAVELCIVIMLVLPNSKVVGLYAALSLMVMFTVYIILASKFSDYVPCSCGGVLQNMTWGQHLVFNLFFIVSGSVAVVLNGEQPTP